jgi:hypothetical protein
MRHGTDGFTSPPKEGVLRIFSPLKIRRLRPGLNPRTWVPKASTLPLDHRWLYAVQNSYFDISRRPFLVRAHVIYMLMMQYIAAILSHPFSRRANTGM